MKKINANRLWTLLFLAFLFAMVVMLASCGRDADYETNTHEITEDFSEISIKTGTADILFIKSDDDTCKVVCYEDKNMRHEVSAEDGTLSINLIDTREWYQHVSWFSSPKITVSLPKAEYDSLTVEESTGDIEIPESLGFASVDLSLSTGDVQCFASVKQTMKINASTGDVSVKNASLGALDLSLSTGDVTISDVDCGGSIRIGLSTGKVSLSNVTCKNLESNGSTGDVILKDTIVSTVLDIDRSTGSIRLERCDAEEISLSTDTGDVNGTLLSEKIFIAKTSTGSIDVPETRSGGICEIATGTGSIHISILE